MEYLNDEFALRSIHVKDFRCFHDARIDLNQTQRSIEFDAEGSRKESVAPLTVLVARNGMGKTTILDAIRILLGTYTSAFASKSLVSADEESIRIYRDDAGQLQRASALLIEGEMLLHGIPVQISRELSAEDGARTTSRNVRPLLEYARKMFDEKERDVGCQCSLPFLAYYGTGRLWGTSKQTQKGKILLKRRDFGYKDCLATSHNFGVVNKWLTQAVNKRRIEDRDTLVRDETIDNQIAAICSALEPVLASEGYKAELTYEVETESLAIRKVLENGSAVPMPIAQLSDGVKVVFGLVADMAFRCAKLNPQYGKEAARSTTGIVMIDEVDLHLHPSWQQKILDALQLAFPRIQFIVTTHSPQVIASVPRECVRIVTPDGIRPFAMQTEGVECQMVLAEIFGVDAAFVENEWVRKLDRYAKMMANGLMESDECVRLSADLDRHYGAAYQPLSRIRLLSRFKTTGRNI